MITESADPQSRYDLPFFKASPSAKFVPFVFSLDLRQLSPVPEQQMIGQLADGVVPASILPAGLVRRKPFDGHVDRNKPVFLVVRGTQLFQQYAPQRRWLWALRVGVK